MEKEGQLSKEYIYNKKLKFIFNAIEDGWTVKKHDGNYIFSKKHDNEPAIFSESYLNEFVIKYISVNKVG
tara:strand:+ start:2838 stop:3047 length:210 start_codon:yes stop_codon:yes gene_type:complete